MKLSSLDLFFCKVVIHILFRNKDLRIPSNKLHIFNAILYTIVGYDLTPALDTVAPSYNLDET